jgi:hypothetical protein
MGVFNIRGVPSKCARVQADLIHHFGTFLGLLTPKTADTERRMRLMWNADKILHSILRTST